MIRQVGKRGGLAALFNELELYKGAEIGVAAADFSTYLCERMPLIELYCIDPWQPYRGNRRGGGLDQQHGNYEIAKKRLAPYNATLIRKMSIDAVKDFEDGSLDFVYIDGNHDFDYVMMDLILWSQKVKTGGVVAGHDYYHFRWAGVVEAADAYIKAHSIRQWYLTNEREPTFYWQKQ